MKYEPSSATNFGKGEHDTPHLTLVAKSIFADDLQLGISDQKCQWVCLRLKQRQAHAQWPGNTDRRADSKATDESI